MATVAAPIDATSTAAWKALEAHQEKLEAEGIDLKAWFAADAERVNKLSFDAGDLLDRRLRDFAQDYARK